MSVKTILDLASVKMGMNPSSTDRSVLLRFLNEAAYEMHMQADMPGSLMEMTFKMNGDMTLSLPWYVGEIRAIRETATFIPWSINRLQPRYYQSNWPDFWRNFRLKGKYACMQAVINEGPVVINVPQVDSPNLTVTITGSTATASQISEIITVNSTQVQSVNSWTDIRGILKSEVTQYDVTVNDIDGRLLSVIPNTEYETWYTIVDISTMPWLATSQSQLDHWVEVLYKRRLPTLTNDGDEYPANDVDHIVANKMVQLWAQEQGNIQLATALDGMNTRSMARKMEEVNRSTQDKVALVYNKHDTLNSRIRPRRPFRYGGYGTTTTMGAGAL